MQNNIQFNESLADNRRQVLYLRAPTDPTSAIHWNYYQWCFSQFQYSCLRKYLFQFVFSCFGKQYSSFKCTNID